MTAARRRRPAGRAKSPAVPMEDRQAVVHREFRQDLAWCIGSNPRTAMRVMRLWRAGLRRGRERNETTLRLRESPAMQERLRRVDEQLKAWGIEPEWPHVKQPFDFDRR